MLEKNLGNPFGHSMKAVLFFESPKEAKVVLEAVKPDLKKGFRRSRHSVDLDREALEIRLEASDLTALRASFNSVMKSIVVSDNILKAFG
ncbi:MAG: KEOPS complex subunit Pcc1 [Candidatus Diapherotrites archaeon]|nr:KEOPS complex subunit Pcc1 [Candidatus Diapherotrites archaeon]